MGKLNKNQHGFTAVEIVLVLAIVTILGAVGWYVWHSKNNSDASYNNATNNTTVTKPVVTSKVTKPVLGITVNHTSRFELFSSRSKDYVAVNVTIKNNSKTTADVSISAFKLKDNQENSYQSYRDVLNGDADNAVIQRTLPKGDTLLSNQKLAVSESVSGSLVYYVPNTLSAFKLTLDGQSYVATIK